MIVEPPDRRGLRRITILGKTVGSAWSSRELRRVLGRLGYPDDMDLDDPSRVYWRGGDSSVWPDDRGWRRRVVIVLMLVGLLGSLALHVVIGWVDAWGALTFAQRLVGALFLLAGAVQAIALPAVVDYWGRRQVRLSGALVLLGVSMALVTTTLLLFLWLQEQEFIATVLLVLALWLWSLWALRTLIREKVWRGIPHPRKFAVGVAVTALLTAISLGYSILYQPIVAPLHFVLKAEFGTPQTGADSPYIHVPLKLYAKNTGGIPVYIVVDDYTVWGYSAKFSESGEGLKEWNDDEASVRSQWVSEAQAFESKVKGEVISAGQFQGPGSTLESGEEFRMEKIITLPKNIKYETLDAVLQFAILRQDRGKLDEEFQYKRLSWMKSEGRYYCPPDGCGELLMHHGRVRYNVNLINLTRKPRYVAAFWSPEVEPDAFISSFDFKKEKKNRSIYDIYKSLDENELERERERYGLYWISVNSEVSVKGLLKQAQP
ncbi:hypothetical protein OG594_19285 [Streptomyces sp. NBC_01214]|uniref:hypothetical protein n=1 Tax=Streptomyces sp. NBC_01214 TaxID=2903777 RepID=UPI0022581671|nr:hypothetical protein [Streptomyces sp. NBC_01214]MCX4803764.1 hypothetical protein [Streptomyces sp. NBC_01214]